MFYLIQDLGQVSFLCRLVYAVGICGWQTIQILIKKENEVNSFFNISRPCLDLFRKQLGAIGRNATKF